jgi:hypothetical protein
MIPLTKYDIDAKIEASNKFFEHTNYLTKTPRFQVDGMNQAELLLHIFNAGFNRGVDYAREPDVEIKKPIQ